MNSLELLFPRITAYVMVSLTCLIIIPVEPLSAAEEGESATSAVLNKYDADKNGRLTGKEIPAMVKQRLHQVDLDSDGQISAHEIDQFPTDAIARLLGSDNRRSPTRNRGGVVNTPGRKGVEGEIYAPAAREEFDPEILKIGYSVPDFTLERYDNKGTVSFRITKERSP